MTMNSQLKNLLIFLILIGLCLAIPYQMKNLKPLIRDIEREEEIQDKRPIHIIEADIEEDKVKIELVDKVNANKSTSTFLWPEPKSFQDAAEGPTLKLSPCRINYKILAPAP
jgi:hypothetical protein